MGAEVPTRLTFQPVTEARLADLDLFSRAHGRFRYCSCMRWRMTSTQFKESTRQERADALEGLVRAGTPVGLLAYADDLPVGWCSVAPREMYAGLERYRALPRVDEKPVWSVVCFFIDRQYRRRHATLGLLAASVDYALSCGATVIEGYPMNRDSGLYAYMGTIGTFLSAGFTDVTPAGQQRRVMRYTASGKTHS